jgi:hypothetical protein
MEPCHRGVAIVGERHRRGHAERDGRVGILDGEARGIGAGQRVRLRRQLTQACRKTVLGARPQPHARLRLTRLAEPGLRQRDHGFHFAALRQPHHRLADGDDLPRLRERRGDDAVGIRLELGIGKLVARELERTPCPFEPAVGLVLGRLLAFVICDGGIAARLQAGKAHFVRGRLGEVRGGGGDLRLCACHLKLEVLRIEPGDDVAGMDEIADIDDPFGDLAGDAEGEIGLVARAHDADEFATRIFRLKRDPLHLYRTLGLGDGGNRLILAGREQRQQGEGGECSQR